MIKSSSKSIVGILILLVLAGIGYHLLLSKENTAQTQPDPSVRVVKVIRQDISENIDLVGSLVSFESVSVKSRLDSQITEVAIKDGDKVEKGQKLFQLDDRVLRAQLAESEANIIGNKAELERAQKQFDRDSSLVKQGVTAQKQFDTSKQTLDAAKAALAATEAKIDLYKTQIDFSTITSPIDGRVGSIKITNGNVVKANDSSPLVIINKINPIKVEAYLPQRYFDRLSKNNLESIKIRLIKAGEKKIGEGELQSIDNQIDENTRSLIVRADLNNADETLWPGMFVDVSLTIEQAKNVMTIPLKSLQRTQKGECVFVIKEGIAKLVQIKVKFISENTAVLEEGGIKEGDLVVTEGAFNLQDGKKVAIMPEKSA